jgi:hypothetical protein
MFKTAALAKLFVFMLPDSRQKTALGACVPLSAEGTVTVLYSYDRRHARERFQFPVPASGLSFDPPVLSPDLRHTAQEEDISSSLSLWQDAHSPSISYTALPSIINLYFTFFSSPGFLPAV